MNAIMQISTSDIGGGAEKISTTLHKVYSETGIQSWLIVGDKKTSYPNVIQIQNFKQRYKNSRYYMDPKNNSLGSRILKYGSHILSLDWHAFFRWAGIEDFDYPDSFTILQRIPEVPDIIHMHNLHGGYFDLRYLVHLSQRVPTVITMHDEWLFTGHCAYTIGCGRWKEGCGHCPDLDRYPAIRHDGTSWNFRRKRRIYAKSKLFINTPSHWLMDKVQESIIQPDIARVIPYGIDQKIFHPCEKEFGKRILGIPEFEPTFLFVANKGKTNPFKDHATIERALSLINGSATFIALGSDGSGSREKQGNITLIQVPYLSDPLQVSRYYQTADIYLHAARADNFPLTVLEALSCGTTVIATGVGGIPEQIRDGNTGFIIPAGDSEAMAARIDTLLGNADLRLKMGMQAAEDARERFGLERMVRDYMDFYEEAKEYWKEQKEKAL